MNERRSRWINEPTDWDRLETDPAALGDRSVTYLVYNAEMNLVKIGFTSNLEQRLRNLQAEFHSDMELLSYRPGRGKFPARQRGDARDVEQDLHDEFREHRCWGEWFHPSPEIYDYFGFST